MPKKKVAKVPKPKKLYQEKARHKEESNPAVKADAHVKKEQKVHDKQQSAGRKKLKKKTV